jgi:AcrR family transcriptional regulator
MTDKTLPRASARERLLDAATELFYREGVHSVGIDRVIEHAGVAKATLYNAFGSKDELIRAYLEAKYAQTRERMERGLERYGTPRERLLGVFDVQGMRFAEPDFRGCGFVRASAESQPGSAAEQTADDYRGWVRSLFTDLATQAGAPDPERLARQLSLIYDGAVTSAWMDKDPSAATASRGIAEVLIDATLSTAGSS